MPSFKVQSILYFHVAGKSNDTKDSDNLPRHASTLGKSMKDQGKPLENISTKFYVGTEVCCF